VVDAGLAMDVVFLDFSKAFDKVPVPHSKLMSQLEGHSITGKILRWIENWLANRRQRVVINGEDSN